MLFTCYLVFHVAAIEADYENRGILIHVCDICTELDTLIPDVGGSHAASGTPECKENPHICSNSNKFRLLLDSTNTAVGSVSLAPSLAAHSNDTTPYVMNFTATESRVLARILVFSFLGRHIVGKLAPGASLDHLPVVFNYNIISQTLDATRPACEYEKGFYMALLVASVVIIIAALVLRFLESTPAPTSASVQALTRSQAKPQNPTEITEHPARTHFGSAQHVPDLRYRLVPSGEW